MSIPASAQIGPLQQSNRSIPLVDKNGVLTEFGKATLDSSYGFINGCSRHIPCNASTTANVITLTMLSNAPLVKQYADFDTFQFVADATSTGLLSAKVVTPQGTLSTLNVYKTNGSAQATTGDVTSGLQYNATFVDSLNSGNGGFVLR
jgi:hypothetical protein